MRYFAWQGMYQSGWPAERVNDNDINWKHSDAKNIAYRYVYGLFDDWVSEG